MCEREREREREKEKTWGRGLGRETPQRASSGSGRNAPTGLEDSHVPLAAPAVGYEEGL